MKNLVSDNFGTLIERNVHDMFRMLVERMPAFISMVAEAQDLALAPKHEWVDYKNKPTEWVVDTQSNTASTALILVSTEGVEPGDRLGFETTAGITLTVQAQVTTVTDGTDLVIARLGADVNIPVGARVFLISRAKYELTREEYGKNRKPLEYWNQTQIEREDIALSRTTMQTRLYGLAALAGNPNLRRENDVTATNMVNFQVRNRLIEIARRINHSMIYGIRTARVDGTNQGHMGGILHFLGAQASSQFNASGAISDTVLNNATDKAGNNGADTANLNLLVCHSVQARKISAFNNNKIQIIRQDTGAGNYVGRFQTDLGPSNGGTEYTIVVDRNFPKDRVALLDPTRIEMVNMQEYTLKETTPKDLDGFSWSILGENTLRVRNPEDGHMLITGLTV